MTSASSVQAPDLLDVGQHVVDLARSLGADEVTVDAAHSVYTDLAQRDGRIEKAQESRSMQVSVDLLVDGRFSSHSTNDLRSDALRTFLERAVAATRYLEPDPDRRLPDRAEMGAADLAHMELDDPDWPPAAPGARRARLAELEARSLEAGQGQPVRSISAFLWDGRIDTAVVTSNGFAHRWQRTSAGYGGSITMEEPDGRLPEAYTSYAARHGADLPPLADVATELVARGVGRLQSGPLASGRYPMLLESRAVGSLLRVLLSPLSGTAVYEGRSCLRDRRDTAIAPARFSLWDDPLIPRALGTQPHTGDGFPAVRRPSSRTGCCACSSSTSTTPAASSRPPPPPGPPTSSSRPATRAPPPCWPAAAPASASRASWAATPRPPPATSRSASAAPCWRTASPSAP